MVRGRKLLWYRVLLVRKVAGTPHVCELAVIVAVGWFIIPLYNSDSGGVVFFFSKNVHQKSQPLASSSFV